MNSLSSQVPFGPERRPDESTRAYQVFCIYRDLGPNRSQDKAWALFCAQRGKHYKSASAPRHWANWSQKYYWVERAATYNDWMEKERRSAAAEQRRELTERRLRLALENQKRLEDQVRDMRLLAENAYKIPLSKVTQTKIDKVTGTRIVTQIGPLNLGGFATFLKVLNGTAQQGVEGVDVQEPEKEERKVDRVVWVRHDKGLDPGEQDHPESGKPQPFSELDTPEVDSEEDKAA